MARAFLKFPHTPHLAWLSPKPLRQDRILSQVEVETFLDGEIVIEEKVDGANIGISVSQENLLQVQNRGSFIEHPAAIQFQPLWSWLDARSNKLIPALGQNLIIFGEWCYAIHSIRYERLPDWFIGFDIYDRVTERFYSTGRRNRLFSALRLFPTCEIARGYYSISQLAKILVETHSSFGSSNIEGLYLRRDSEDWLEKRAKIVRAEFNQSISTHWSSRTLRRNTIAH